MTSCTVTYQFPRHDGDAPLTGYVVERRTPNGPDSKWIRDNDAPVTALQLTVDNLMPATDYEFRVAAKNKHCISALSLPSRIIPTVEIPDKLGCPEVQEMMGTTVRLQWTTPDSDGGTNITEYRIVCRAADETEQQITVAADSSMERLVNYTIRNTLQPCTAYTFAVAAVNRMGPGPWSERTESKITTSAGTYRLYILLTRDDCNKCEVVGFSGFTVEQGRLGSDVG